MANSERGEYDITIAGTTYTCALKTAGLIALQKHFSTPESVADLNDILQRISARSIEHIVAAFWASLRKYHPEVSYDDAVNLLDQCEDTDQLQAMFGALLFHATPDPADVVEVKPARGRPRKARAISGETGSSKLAASA